MDHYKTAETLELVSGPFPSHLLITYACWTLMILCSETWGGNGLSLKFR